MVQGIDIGHQAIEQLGFLEAGNGARREGQ